MDTEQDFRFSLPVSDLEIVEKADEKGRPPGRYIKGYASTEALDGEGEKVAQKGLDLGYFLRRGWINYDHRRDDIVGVPTAASVDQKGFLMEARLLEGLPLADHTWQTAQALHKSGTGRSLGLSIEGKALERKGNTIVRARVYNVAITPHPQNPEATFDVLMRSMLPCSCTGAACCKPGLWKALDVGYTTEATAKTGGDALRRESLGGVKTTTFKVGEKKNCSHLKGRARRMCEAMLDEKGLDLDDTVLFVQVMTGVGRELAEQAVRESAE